MEISSPGDDRMPRVRTAASQTHGILIGNYSGRGGSRHSFLMLSEDHGNATVVVADWVIGWEW